MGETAISPIRTLRRWTKDAYEYATFNSRSSYGRFRGKYRDFPQAERDVPRKRRIGYDHAELARQYVAEMALDLESGDYPRLFHLARILAPDSTVLDFGGNVGVHFLRYRKYLDLQNVRWIVCEVPAIAAAGRTRCAGIPNVEFVDDLADIGARQVDLLLGCGSLQYVASPAVILKRLEHRGLRPASILVDHVPLYGGEQFVTLQNGGLVHYPQYVFNRAAFIAAVEQFDYELKDSWSDAAYTCLIPFHREESIHAYSGLLFRSRA